MLIAIPLSSGEGGAGDCEPSILRRFTRSNIRYPTYKALAELGKAITTAFLCHTSWRPREPLQPTCWLWRPHL
jgi:hypothetical protein